jgi:hypothetical protein
LFTWVRLEEPFLQWQWTRNRYELAVGHDFLLVSREGVFTVRIDGLRLLGHPDLSEGGIVDAPQPGRLGEALAAFDPRRAVMWSELHVRDGDALEVTGVCRQEPALEGGLRDSARTPALTGAGARLDVRFLG